jgi:transposase
MGACTRKFYDLQQAHTSRVVAKAIARIGQSHSFESEIRGRLADRRRQIRQARARPVLDSLQQWLQAELAEL